jgi:peptide deformylase
MILVSPIHPALRTLSTKVTPEAMAEVRAMYPAMSQLMMRHRGVGLAANQIGDTRRFFVWQHGMAINPVITQRSEDFSTKSEGCLSFPGKSVPVARHEWIDCNYVDERGVVCSKHLTGLNARVFQHELDHLNGVCIVP